MATDGAIKIDKGIPLPQRKPHKTKYPWETMDVGDSFLCPGITSAAYPLATSAGARYAPKKFQASETTEGWRIWRTA